MDYVQVENKEQLKKELIARGWLVFPKMDTKNLSKSEWDQVLYDIENQVYKYVCMSVEETLGIDPEFVTEFFKDDQEVTCWHFLQTEKISGTNCGWLEGFGRAASRYYRVLWIENILENYDV